MGGGGGGGIFVQAIPPPSKVCVCVCGGGGVSPPPPHPPGIYASACTTYLGIAHSVTNERGTKNTKMRWLTSTRSIGREKKCRKKAQFAHGCNEGMKSL